jgi:hypothetical protein
VSLLMRDRERESAHGREGGGERRSCTRNSHDQMQVEWGEKRATHPAQNTKRKHADNGHRMHFFFIQRQVG